MLKAGDRLGAYEVVAPLGAGGMGEVYRARDTRLDRTVAIKLLSGQLARTPEAEARFQREARAIAALQHPNICVLHDLGREGDTSYLVMEYLEGETLAERLRRGPLPLAQLQAIGGQIAAALARAHRAGIIHRDLKPANIMLTGAGAQAQAKLLDFGLAKAGVSTAVGGDTPTLPAATQAGAVLGTIPYMAPEQIAGREADARSDIYAFGCVLYEMATAQPAFAGVREVAPPALQRLIHACLEPDPEARLESAHDAGMMLAAVTEAPGVTASRSPRPGWLWTTVTALAVVLAAALAWWLRPTPAAARTVTEITPPPGLHFEFGGTFPGPPAVSPDGRQVVFSAHNASGRSALWLRSLDGLQERELPGTQGGVLPFWSPDSRSIAYFTARGPASAGKLMVLNLAGGLPRTLTTARTARGGAWTPIGGEGGTIVFSPAVTGGLMRISAQGGAATPAVPFNAAQFDSFRFPSFLPDGKHFLYLAINHSDSAQDTIFLASLDGAAPKPLIHSLSAGIFAAGRLLYSSNRTLMAQPLDPATGTLSGSPQPMAQDVFEDSVTWRAAYSASRNGVLVYAGGDTGEQQLAWADRSGHLSPPLPTYSGEAFTAAIAPDGRQLAVSFDQGLQDIWVERTPLGAFDRLTFGPVANLYPTWSPDGKWIAYAGGNNGIIFRRPAAGGPEQTISRAPHADDFLYPVSWSQDGRELVCDFYPGQGAKAVVAVPAAGGAVRTVATLPNQDLAGAALSPDNRWVSYLAGEQGQPTNVYLVPFRGGGGAVWQATTAGAMQQFWTQGGRELDVVDNADRLLAIPVSTGADGTPVFGAPRILADNFPAALAAAGDGQRYLVTTFPHDHQKLVVVTGWQSHN